MVRSRSKATLQWRVDGPTLDDAPVATALLKSCGCLVFNLHLQTLP
jgi:hypothetical protein